MKRLNKKVLIAALSVMLVMCAAVTMLSFSLAGSGNNDISGTTVADTAEAADGKTNIDYIIEFSNSTSEDVDPMYHIVEIGSSNTPSSLKDLASNKFKSLVVDGNRTIEDLMAEGKVDYKFYGTPSLKGNDEKIEEAKVAVINADLIYVSNDPSSEYTKTNDIPEAIKLELSTAAVADYKPFIIDSPAATAEIKNNKVKTFTSLADSVFYVYGNSRYTFSWKSDVSGEAYLSRTDGSSRFLPIHGDTTSEKWEQVSESDGTNTTIAKILTISNGTSDSTITTKVLDGNTEAYTPSTIATSTDASEVTYDNVVKLNPDSVLYKYGYKSNEVKPDCVRHEVIDISNTTEKEKLNDIDLSDYDMVIIEGGCNGQVISDDGYSILSSAVYSLKHILYDSAILSGKTSSQAVTKSSAVNYQYVVDKTMNSSEIANNVNILVCNQEKMNTIASATEPAGMSEIVKIINNGTFRGIGGPNSSANYYTVLEIQPCYPIDTVLADKFTAIKDKFDSKSKRTQMDNNDPGFYYLRTDSVINGLTSDEITMDGKNSITEMESTGDYSAISSSNKDNVKDYYAWEISKAKVAHATGMPYDQIRVVHMSSTEFACSKASLLDNYDFIYIGGNNSSIKSISHFVKANTGNASIFNMYYHDGDYYWYDSSLYGSAGNSGIGRLVGNDITDEKLDELEKYIEKGMPVVFGSSVSNAFDAITDANKYSQTNIDPESNMYKLLVYAKTKYETGDSGVLWNFNTNDTVKIANEAEEYGATYNGYATVFGGVATEDYLGKAVTPKTDDVNEAALMGLLKSASQRPKLVLTEKPVTFKEGDSSTAVTNKNLKFTYQVTGSADSYKMNIYIDDDGNSRFTEEEIVQTGSGSGVGTISCDLASDFFGPVYWKFEVVDAKTGVSSSTTGITKIKRGADDPKDEVNLLQILPENCTGHNGAGTLWFCTECQQSKLFLNGNRYYQGKYEEAPAKGIGFTDSGVYDISGSTYPLPDISSYDSSYTYKGNCLGVHEHKFGIVKYDANLTINGKQGYDDWTTNWADTLYDDYDFNTTIITTREYEALCQNIASKYSEKTVADIQTTRDVYLGDAADYKLYYDVMTKMINGEYSEVDAADKTAFEKYMKETLKVSESTLVNFTTCQSNLDVYIDKIYADMVKNNKSYFDKTPYNFALTELRYEQKYHTYYDFYSLFNSKDNFSGNNSALLRNSAGDLKYTDYFVVWRNAKIYQQYFKQKYMENLELGSYTDDGKVDLTDVFSIIVLGAAENFGNDDIKTDVALDALEYYMDNDGNVLFFHDTINQNGNSGKKLTDRLRAKFGQDNRHVSTTATGNKYDSTALDGYKESEYHLASVTTNGSKFSSTALTSRSALGSCVSGGNAGGYMHKYTIWFPSDSEGVPVQDSQFEYDAFAASGSQIGTNRATQNNPGIVTMYPFTIDSELMISATHPQAFALDVEDPELTVWYSLSGGSFGTQSSPFVSDPQNGVENYFIYTYNNITYCGAGHSLLTGIAKNNNDERRLFINIICNTVRKTAIGTSIKVYDYDSKEDAKTNNIVQMDVDGNYYIKVDDTTSAPTFSFVAKTDTNHSVEVANVKIYYDLAYLKKGLNAYEADNDHILIFNKDYPEDSTIGSGKLKKIDSSVALGKKDVNGVITTALNLKPEYFAPYNNEYTYIVIAVTDTKGKVTYKRIKILQKPYLFDMT